MGPGRPRGLDAPGVDGTDAEGPALPDAATRTLRLHDLGSDGARSRLPLEPGADGEGTVGDHRVHTGHPPGPGVEVRQGVPDRLGRHIDVDLGRLVDRCVSVSVHLWLSR